MKRLMILAAVLVVFAPALVACGPKAEVRQPLDVPEQPSGVQGALYQTGVYKTEGGKKLVVGSGGELEVLSGGTIDLQSGATTDFSAGVDLDGADLTIDADGDSILDETSDDNIRLTSGAAGGIWNVLTGNLKVGNGTPGITLNGEDAYIEGNAEIHGDVYIDGNTTITGTITGGVYANDLNGANLVLDPTGSTGLRAQTDDQAKLTTADAAGFFQVTTGSLRVGNGSNGQALTGGEACYIEKALEVDGMSYLDGGATTTTITGANAETLDNATNGYWDIKGAGLTQTSGTANGIGFDSWVSASVITTTNGTLWTVPSSQTWAIKHVVCKVGTNFDCTGNDCTLIVGNTEDTDGFLTLADAELQAADTEGTGFDAGWQGLVAATVGAFLDPNGIFVLDNTDTIDIVIEDSSDNSNPTAGAATCWLNYVRIQ